MSSGTSATRRLRIQTLIWASLIALAGCSGEPPGPAATVEPSSPPLPGEGEDAGRTVIYRDTWGVPHIYAPTVEAGFYAMGYAQAEDRPEQLLVNLKIAMGELAEIAGEAQVPQDVIARLFDHYGIARGQWPQASPVIRQRLQAFTCAAAASNPASPARAGLPTSGPWHPSAAPAATPCCSSTRIWPGGVYPGSGRCGCMPASSTAAA